MNNNNNNKKPISITFLLELKKKKKVLTKPPEMFLKQNILVFPPCMCAFVLSRFNHI